MTSSAKGLADGATDGLLVIFASLRDDARNNRDLGDRFERMMCRYFEVDPLYADRFDKVWMWNDWPAKPTVGDGGIDLVARDRATGEHCAIQCKFYLPDQTLAKGDVDSFVTAMGREQFTSGLIVSTTDRWGKNALDALHHQTKPVQRIGVRDLEESGVDWSGFDFARPQDLTHDGRRDLREHQRRAQDDVIAGFADADRGKLVMACGTGKTFTALRIAESMVPRGNVLFLVPSLSLLAQALREWTRFAAHGLTALAVCSDINVGKSRKKNDDGGDITIQDLLLPATTRGHELAWQHKLLRRDDRPTVVFSTYHSIAAVAEAQEAGMPAFDLVICDEAHRTTGVTLAGEDESHFVKVHDADYLKAKKRLYMTATPRLYGDEAKKTAKEGDAALISMDDLAVYGDELHRLGFGEAVGKSLLTDYKVLVLAVDEKYVARTFQKQLAGDGEMNLDDATRITGCWNGLEKRFESTLNGAELNGDVEPMRRAVAFSRTIKDSKRFVAQFGQLVEAYREEHPDADGVLDVEADHVDGSDDALRRAASLDWLKRDAGGNACRVLSNARCLSEGVDVPALDAVMFLNPRNSVVDVVQSVGRVMRRAPGKRYGYIILPVGVPADKTPEEALKDNDRYRVVWQVLQALRAHDDRFDATVNQIELNRDRPDQIQVIGVGGLEPGDNGNGAAATDGDGKPRVREVQGAFAFPGLEDWKDAIYAKIVKKCGDRQYWESWAKDIAVIAERHVTRIKTLVQSEEQTPQSRASHAEELAAFVVFVKALQTSLNPTVSDDDAIEMLAQHSITRPVFDALFKDYAFASHNPVSVSMQTMLDRLDAHAVDREADTLEKFYQSVRERASGLDNAEARGRVLNELYEEFFRNAFPKIAERLGIVYTPIEVVDFILHSVQDVLQQEFGKSFADEGVHTIDPFTGTGTFLVRLMQSGLIPPDKLPQKYKSELWANEMVLLAYYIAAVNIEQAYHDLVGGNDYEPFNGIVLTDTFQMFESDRAEKTRIAGTFPVNTERARKQMAADVTVVIANPPYSVGQGDANANNQNLKYDALDAKIGSTYAARSTATNKNSLYDSYVRAIRWASDRIGDSGVVGFVTNGYFIDGNAADGMRACLADEFTSLYVLNLRGNQRTSGETSRREGGKIFGSGSRNSIAVILLVKNPDKTTPGTIHYHDIGDYLTRTEKLATVKRFGSIVGVGENDGWKMIKPNAGHDWINQRDEAFETFPALASRPAESTQFFSDFWRGLETARDPWCYNFSKNRLLTGMKAMINVFNEQSSGFRDQANGFIGDDRKQAFEDYAEADPKKISWSRALQRYAIRGNSIRFKRQSARNAMYRPFMRCHVYLDRRVNNVVGGIDDAFPNADAENRVICVTSVGNRGDFSLLMTDAVPDLHMSDKSGASQCFPLYLYDKPNKDDTLYTNGDAGCRRRDGITDAALSTFRDAYADAGGGGGEAVGNEDVFYYVYGVLHSPEYRERFAADLKKMLPRIPLTREAADFWVFSQAGRDLAHWHLNYETIDPYPLAEHMDTLDFDPWERFKVKKMTFARPTPEQRAAGERHDKTQIVYNAHLTLRGIPPEAYDYVVNGRSAIEWVMDRYQVRRDKKSGIVNDPNDWCREHDDPRYIADLICRVVRVSLETMKIVNALPALNERAGAKA
jgi:predicted helicase